MTEREPETRESIPYATPAAPSGRRVAMVVAAACAAMLAVASGAYLYGRRSMQITVVASTNPLAAPAGGKGFGPPPSAWSPPPPAPPTMSLAATSPRFTVPQRDSDTLPGSSGTVYLALDDITGGQVQADVRTTDGQRLAGASLRRGGALPFTVGGSAFVVVLAEFHNHLIGDDVAEWVVRPATAPATSEEQIALLIMTAADGGATVEWPDAVDDGEPPPRNDRADEPRPLARYLEDVWMDRSNGVGTTSDLIREAQRPLSPTSGAPRVRFDDGRTLPLGEWLSKQSKKGRD